MPEIKYADNPNEETAFVTQDDGTRSRAVLTAAVEGDIEFPDNPNSTKVMVTIDGVKRKAVAVANVAGEGGGGGITQVRHDDTLKGKGTSAEPLGISDEVMEKIEHGGDFVPQYDTMPTASVSNVNEIAQYSGESVADSYQKGYFYINQPTYTDPSATISQTVGSGLTDLSINADAFVEAEQPTQSENVSFVANIEDAHVTFGPQSTDSFTMTIDEQSYIQQAKDNWGDNWPQFILPQMFIVYNGAEWLICRDQQGTQTVASMGGVIVWSVTGTYNTGDWVETNVVSYGGLTWSKNGTTVDLADYGISYSGAPVNGDTLTVAYTAPVVTGYAWNQINIQPAAEATGIEWKTKVDLPAEYTGDPWNAKPYYTITGGLPDGTYEFYFSTKVTSNPEGQMPLGKVIFKVIMAINNTDNTFYGRMGYVFDGNYMNDNNTIFGGEEKQINTFVLKNGSDMILFGTEYPWISDVFGYITPRLVPECFKLSAIKNVDTGDEYIATGAINLDGSWPAYTTQYSGWVKLTQLVNPPFIPSTTGSFVVPASDFATKTISLVREALDCSVHLDTDGSELIINFTGNTTGNSRIDPYSQEIIRATGIFAGCYLAYRLNYIYVMGVDTTTAATLSGSVNCTCSGLSNNNMAMWFDTIPTDPLTPLAQFGPQAYRLGTITADGVGNMVQYTGATDSNYTNGYFYKANGTLTPVPASITFTDFNPSDITVTVADADTLVTALNNVGGWGEQWVRDILAQNQMNFTIEYDFDTGTVTKVWWSNYGDIYQQDVLDCFAVSTTGSYSGVQNVEFWCNMGYTPAHYGVTNPSWDRVDVQPSSGGATYTAGNGISIDANNEISVTAPTVQNYTTVSGALQITDTTPTAISTGLFSTAVGINSYVKSINGIAIGRSSYIDINSTDSIVIGNAAYSAGDKGAIVIGGGSARTQGSGTFSVSLSTTAMLGEWTTYKVLDSDGTVPADRLASTTGLADGNYRLRLVMASGVPTLEWVAE